jgi:hypothetical protein
MYRHINMTPRSFLIASVLTAVSTLAPAQTSNPTSANVPTTRVLAIGRLTEGATREAITPVMQREVRDTVRLYLAGKLDQWFVRRDQNGVVFLLNVSSIAEARALLEKLPLGEAKLMAFDLIPLGPLTPLGLLIQDPAPPKK